jgi:hypothetical protein
MSFIPSSYGTIQSVYGAADSSSGSKSYLEMAEQYTPLLKSLLFDEDPRIAYEKKNKELAAAIASYKSSSGVAKNALASKIRDLQAEIHGLSAQAESLSTAETTAQAGKVAGVGILGTGIVVLSLVGYLFYEKAATERARRHQIVSGKMGA